MDSLTLLDLISRKVKDLPVLLVGNYRDDERPDLPGTLPVLQTIQLKRLPADVVRRLVASMLGSAGASPVVTEFLQRETEGNAFFLFEAGRALASDTTRLDEMP